MTEEQISREWKLLRDSDFEEAIESIHAEYERLGQDSREFDEALFQAFRLGCLNRK
jgi:hypothetical protein